MSQEFYQIYLVVDLRELDQASATEASKNPGAYDWPEQG